MAQTNFSQLGEKAKSKNPFPASPVNNQLVFRYPTLFLYKARYYRWFPLPTDRFSDNELKNINTFVTKEYYNYNTVTLTNSELCADLSVWLKGKISKQSLDILIEFILVADLQTVLENNFNE